MAFRSTWQALTISVSVVFLVLAGCSDDDDDGGGAAGEAGSAGSAGTAGGTAGGNGGTGGSLIGSGGSSGANLEGGADGSTCTVTNLDFGEACNTCTKENCCTELSACDGKPECVALIKCVIACPVDVDAGGAIDQACIQTCATKHPVPAEYAPAQFCIASKCAAPCPF